MLSTLQVAQVIPATEAEGPGRRLAIWLQGCPLRCPGCCNPQMLPFAGGRPRAVDALVAEIRQAHEQLPLEGLTLLGGEPFAQAAAAAALAGQVQRLGLSVMVFSGYTLAELRAIGDEHVDRLLECTDILVDGPYLRDQPELRRRWIGSANQQIHFLTDRCRADDPRWLLPNTLEIRLVDGALVVNGFPAANATDFWRRLPLQVTNDNDK
jgi:anaerobic ribonucleoside-triphosphate reductase activating protein